MNDLEMRLNALLDEALEEDALENEPAVEQAEDNGFEAGYTDATPIADDAEKTLDLSNDADTEVKPTEDIDADTEAIISDAEIQECLDAFEAYGDLILEGLDEAERDFMMTVITEAASVEDVQERRTAIDSRAQAKSDSYRKMMLGKANKNAEAAKKAWNGKSAIKNLAQRAVAKVTGNTDKLAELRKTRETQKNLKTKHLNAVAGALKAQNTRNNNIETGRMRDQVKNNKRGIVSDNREGADILAKEKDTGKNIDTNAIKKRNWFKRTFTKNKNMYENFDMMSDSDWMSILEENGYETSIENLQMIYENIYFEDTIDESFDRITALLDSLNEELDGAPESKIENTEIEDGSADKSDVYPDDEDETTDEIPDDVDIDTGDIYGSEDEETSTDLKESYVTLFNILEEAGVLSVEKSEDLAAGLEDETLEKDTELKDFTVDKSDVYPDDEDDTETEIPDSIDRDNEDFYNDETEAEATEVDSIIEEALDIIREMDDIQILEFLDANGIEPSIENAQLLERKVYKDITGALEASEDRRNTARTAIHRAKIRQAKISSIGATLKSVFTGKKDAANAQRVKNHETIDTANKEISKEDLKTTHNVAAIGGKSAKAAREGLAANTRAKAEMEKNYAAGRRAKEDRAHELEIADADAKARREREKADADARRATADADAKAKRSRDVADADSKRERDNKTADSQRRIADADNDARNSRTEAIHASSRDRAEKDNASALKKIDLASDAQRVKSEADAIGANAKAHKSAMKKRVKHNRPDDGDTKGKLWWKKKYDASTGTWVKVKEDCELTDLELMEILEYNNYDTTIENAMLLREGLEAGEYEIFYEEDELDVSDPKEEQYDIDAELEPEEDTDDEVKPEDLHEEDELEPEDLISHEKAEKPEGGEADQNLEIAGDSEENHEDPTTDLPIENKESDSEVKPEDIHESVQYTSIKEACMLDEGYFYEDTFIRESAEVKQAKLVEQVALILARESADPLYEELLKSAAYTARLQEACGKKYKNKASKEAMKIMGKPKGTLSENFH